jgi:hypothetical protein
MYIQTLISLVIVVLILVYSLSITFGFHSMLLKMYKNIKTYIRHIPVFTFISIGLVLGSIILAVIASM